MFVLFFPTLPIKYNRKINKIKIHKIHKPKHISSSFIGSVNTNKILRIQKAFQYIIGGVNTNKIKDSKSISVYYWGCEHQ